MKYEIRITCKNIFYCITKQKNNEKHSALKQVTPAKRG